MADRYDDVQFVAQEEDDVGVEMQSGDPARGKSESALRSRLRLRRG